MHYRDNCLQDSERELTLDYLLQYGSPNMGYRIGNIHMNITHMGFTHMHTQP